MQIKRVIATVKNMLQGLHLLIVGIELLLKQIIVLGKYEF